MAKERGNKSQAPETSQAPGAPQGWEQVQTSRPYYAIEKCQRTPLQGYLLNLERMPPNDKGPWDAFIIRTTAEVLGMPPPEIGSSFDANAEREPVIYPAHTEIVIQAAVKLRQALQRFLHPEKLFEVCIIPTAKVKIGPENEMWQFDVRANPSGVKQRPAHYPLAEVRRRPPDDGIPF